MSWFCFQYINWILSIYSLSLLVGYSEGTTPSAMISNESDENWWKSALVYQIYPRSFMDSNGDGIGDLQGIISKLDHLVDIAIDAIWLSPIFASPMVDFGYDISDFKSIHPDYGTMQDFEELLNKAGQLGIRVLLDFVPNHTSDQCMWFQKSALRDPEYKDFYIWSDGKVNEKGLRVPPNNWVSNFYGSAWTWNDKRQQYYFHQFAKEQPDLNFRNPNVLAAMDDILIYWLEKGVAGFRIDAFNHIFEDIELKDEPLSGKTLDENSYDYTNHIYTKNLPELHNLIEHWRELFDNYSKLHAGPERIMMTEAYADVKVLMDYYETPQGKAGVHFPFNFIMITDLNAQSDARDFAFYLQKWLTYMPLGYTPNWVMGNHDVPRVATRFSEHLTDAMNMLLLTLPGVAVTYNGEEIGMESNNDITWSETVDPAGINVGEQEYQNVSRDPTRTPFQWNAKRNAGFTTAEKTWLPVHKNYVDLNLAAQKEAPKSHFKVYKALSNLRQSSPVLRKGRTKLIVVNKAVFLLKRKLKGHGTLFTVINLSEKAQKVNLSEFSGSCKKFKVLIASSNSPHETDEDVRIDAFYLSAHEGLVGMLHAEIVKESYINLPPRCAKIVESDATSRSSFAIDDRRLLIKTIIKSLNIILVALLMYKLWNNKWTKLQIYNKQKETFPPSVSVTSNYGIRRRE